MSSLACPDCSRPIPVADRQAETGLAKCRGCDEIFRFAAVAERLPVPIPAGFDLRRDSEALLLSWRWFEPMHGQLILFTLLWNGILLWDAIRFSLSALQGPSPASAIGIHLAGTVLTGLPLIYITLSYLLNSTSIRVTREGLSLRHGPLPMPGKRNQQLYPVMLDQLYVQEMRRLRWHERFGRDEQEIVRSYDLVARLKDSNEVRLLNLPEAGQAEFIEVEIERYLGIHDRAMEHEVARRLM